MIGFLIFLVIAFLAFHAWINYSRDPSAGRLFLAVLLTVLALPSLIGAIFKVTVIALVVIAVIAVISALVGAVSGGKASD